MNRTRLNYRPAYLCHACGFDKGCTCRASLELVCGKCRGEDAGCLECDGSGQVPAGAYFDDRDA
jgi:hypothetical protein